MHSTHNPILSNNITVQHDGPARLRPARPPQTAAGCRAGGNSVHATLRRSPLSQSRMTRKTSRTSSSDALSRVSTRVRPRLRLPTLRLCLHPHLRLRLRVSSEPALHTTHDTRRTTHDLPLPGGARSKHAAARSRTLPCGTSRARACMHGHEPGPKRRHVPPERPQSRTQTVTRAEPYCSRIDADAAKQLLLPDRSQRARVCVCRPWSCVRASCGHCRGLRVRGPPP